jgi:hypothetical protein
MKYPQTNKTDNTKSAEINSAHKQFNRKYDPVGPASINVAHCIPRCERRVFYRLVPSTPEEDGPMLASMMR